MADSGVRRVVAGLVLMVLVVGIAPVGAQSDEGAKSGLAVRPLRHELTLQAGSTGSVELSVENLSGVDVVAKAEINDFVSDNESGEPKIYVGGSKEITSSIKPFVPKINSVPLKKGERKDIMLEFDIPKNASPGGYYGLLRYTAYPDQGQREGQGVVSLNASVGTIILLEIPGKVKEKMEVESIKVLRDKNVDNFFFAAPNKVAVSIKNDGNGFIRPFGPVEINDPFGKTVLKYDLNNLEPKGNVLPMSSRTFTDTLKGVKWPGRYTITASVAPNAGREVLLLKKSFWYMPWWFIAVLVVVVGGVAAGIMFIRSKLNNTLCRRR